MHFDDSFSDESGPKECPEWDEKVATSDASKIKERVGNLGGKWAGERRKRQRETHTHTHVHT